MIARKSIEFKTVLCGCLLLLFVMVGHTTGNGAPIQNPTIFRCITGWEGEERCKEGGPKPNHHGVDIKPCKYEKIFAGDQTEVRPYSPGKVAVRIGVSP
jgi:hypothetical protein